MLCLSTTSISSTFSSSKRSDNSLFQITGRAKHIVPIGATVTDIFSTTIAKQSCFGRHVTRASAPPEAIQGQNKFNIRTGPDPPFFHVGQATPDYAEIL